MHLCLIPFRVSYRSLFFLFGPLMPLMVIACQSTRWWRRLGPKRRWLKRSWLSATSAWWWIWKENSIAHITSEQTHWTAGRQRMSSFLCNIFTPMLYTCYCIQMYYLWYFNKKYFLSSNSETFLKRSKEATEYYLAEIIFTSLSAAFKDVLIFFCFIFLVICYQQCGWSRFLKPQ